jgi:[ribosomal protein S5]-alanine N-acetyltransferase
MHGDLRPTNPDRPRQHRDPTHVSAAVPEPARPTPEPMRQPMVETFRTARLIAERLRAGDLHELCRMHRDPRVMATLGGIRSDDETRRFLRDNLDHWDHHGYGLWIFRDPGDGQFVGRGGLRKVHVGGNDEVELAYALLAAHWGQGLAMEMAEAILTVGFERLGLSAVVAFTLPTNRASRRVMEKVGCTFERDIIHAGLPHVLYRVNASARQG